ncbi:GNAT family N-acetyltransferase [Bacillus sp. SD088]|uniref:GNAT family N-acetyltransferase n=1 Tax=Bacillus sp. SD088 TaxID=2782012 RepID=UPI001A965A90|nr:GNAT family N-acetyltransferase [Bacillus sp. SD088]MBO0991765.1 GNAT family N-acetyltransferase [Bacillus sp. SD088]
MKLNLTTERLIITNFKKEDWREVFGYASNPEVMYYMPEGVLTEREAKMYVNQQIGDKPNKYAVLLKSNQALIGHVEFFNYFGEHTYEIGWVLHPKYHNKGYTTEAAKALLAYGFKVLNLHRIVATCQPENVPSYRVMEKIGMRREAFFKKCIPAGDTWWDELYYAILHDEYVDNLG